MHSVRPIGVPILTQSEDWALFVSFLIWKLELMVPILTQSEDWALSPNTPRKPPTLRFQSSPSPKTGRYISLFDVGSIEGAVPILTQSEDWALLDGVLRLGREQIGFQSSPSPKTGRYTTLTLPANTREAFVPILTQSEDWALSGARGAKGDTGNGSNPHPVRRLGAIRPTRQL